MITNEIKTIFNEEEKRFSETISNEEAIAQVFFDYHGRYDDGNSPADAFEMKGVVIA